MHFYILRGEKWRDGKSQGFSQNNKGRMKFGRILPPHFWQRFLQGIPAGFELMCGPASASSLLRLEVYVLTFDLNFCKRGCW